MTDNKNMILAVVLSALVLLGWSLVSDRFVPTAGPQTVRVENGKAKPIPQPQADPTADRPQAMRSRATVLASTPRVRIETPSLKGSINLQGARIDTRVLLREREGTPGLDGGADALAGRGAGLYFARFGWSGDGVRRRRPTRVGAKRASLSRAAGDVELTSRAAAVQQNIGVATIT